MIARRVCRALVLIAVGIVCWPNQLGFSLSGQTRTTAPGYDPALFSDMRWRAIGPFRGGRTKAVAGVPSQPGGGRRSRS